MGNRWPDGPPEEAYSRVTRDLVVVYAGLPGYADHVVDRLRATYDVSVGAATPDESTRLASYEPVRSTAVRPVDPRCAPLVLGWTTLPGVVMAYGHRGTAVIPRCGCDACDEDGDDVVRELDDAVAIVIGGFEEFVRRRLFRVEHGIRYANGGSATHLRRHDRGYAAMPRRSGTVRWQPWRPAVNT